MIIAHNTFTYLPVKGWWKTPFLFLARCQKHDYRTLHERFGVDGYDVRVWYTKRGTIEFRHGLFAFHADDFDEFMAYCDARGLTIRLSLECRTPRMKKFADEYSLKFDFRLLCHELRRKYPNIKFFGGRSMYDWELLCDFVYEPDVVDCYGSVAPDTSSLMRKIWGAFPRMWSRTHKHVVKEYMVMEAEDRDTCYLFDFIGV